jgi:hypothetical protein
MAVRYIRYTRCTVAAVQYQVGYSSMWKQQHNSNCLEEGLACDPVVVDHTTDGQHSQTSILDFLQLHLSHLVLTLILCQSQRVESKVSWLTLGVSEHGLHGDISLVCPEFQDTHPDDDLQHGGSSNDIGGKVSVINVLVAWKSPPLLQDESEGSKHGRASMLDFGLTEPLDVEVVRETKGVEANISDISLQVLGFHDEGKRFRHISIELGADSEVGL